MIFSYEISKVHEKPCNANSGGKRKTVRVSGGFELSGLIEYSICPVDN